MKTALITTTINVPHVLKLYRVYGPDVRFFVAGDRKTPTETYKFCAEIRDCCCLDSVSQKAFGYACSELIGWNVIARRNIALLEALKWGAEIIVTSDDDNIPIGGAHFDNFTGALAFPFSGIAAYVKQLDGWFDPGLLLDPPASHRGFPLDVNNTAEFKPITNARIGVAAGMCLGDPDISAITRIANHPTVHKVSELLRAGIVVDPQTRTVFNSQNTSFLRELAPAMCMHPAFGRYDDIFASLITQKIMRAKGLHVHFGQPFVWQQRNAHNLLNDLKAEMFGMEHIISFAGFLGRLTFTSDDVIANLRFMYDALEKEAWCPPIVRETGIAWLTDCEKVT